MAVRSRRIFGPTPVALGATVILYTVPAGRTAVFRLVTIANPSGTTADVRLTVNNTGNPGAIWRGGVQALGNVEAVNDLVLNPGDVLRALATLSDVVVSGYGSLLDGEPS